MLVRSHAWTPSQKCLLAIAVVICVIAFSTLVYCYERYHRGPTDRVLFGTWEVSLSSGDNVYFRLKPDYTFDATGDLKDPKSVFMHGSWYAGGEFVYFKQPEYNDWGDPVEHRLEWWHLQSISADQLQVGFNPNGRVHTFKRVSSDPP